MTDFWWIISKLRQDELGAEGVANRYVIPQQHMNNHQLEVAGKFIWMLLRDDEDRCVCVFRVQKVERIVDGYHTGDFLLSTDLTAATRLQLSYERSANFHVAGTKNLQLGVHLADSDHIALIREAISKSIEIKLEMPFARYWSVDFQMDVKRNEVALARSALLQLVQKMRLDNVWRSAAHSNLGPFSNFAKSVLSKQGLICDATQVMEFLKNNDPLELVLAAGSIDGGAPLQSPDYLSRVSLDFDRIDPQQIYAREFVSSASHDTNWDEAALKTEAAEQIHQSMLTDISSYLIEEGITPYQSASIDLMFRLADRVKIFEIKSANAENIVSQVSKGIFQLSAYHSSFIKIEQNVDSALIVNKIDDIQISTFVSHVLKHLGVKFLIYDKSLNWPDRVRGLTT
jgi:hypothetical protein